MCVNYIKLGNNNHVSHWLCCCNRRSMRVFGVKSSLIEPGMHETPIASHDAVRREMEAAWKDASPEVKEEFGDDYLEKGMFVRRAFGLCSYPVTKVLEMTNDGIEELTIPCHLSYSMWPRSNFLHAAAADK